MSNLVKPHGGRALKPLLVDDAQKSEAKARAATLRRVPMTSRETSDVVMMAMGAYTPLSGFMGASDWRSVVTEMKMSDGLFWPIPITLSVDSDLAGAIRPGEDVALVDEETGTIMGIMTVTEKYRIDRALECANVFRTNDPNHPGVQKVVAQGEFNLAGPVLALDEGPYPTLFKDIYFSPQDSRSLFDRLGWETVAAFQTRNPMHRSHEYLVKLALEMTDGVFIHQVLGKLKEGDIPAEVRVKAIAAMVDHYFVPGSVVQGGYPIEMRYAGPREALLHALLRQNFGCSHLIVGRDHAGVGSYYGPFDSQRIFADLWPGALETKPIKIDVTFYCHRCYGMATSRTCPHGDADRVVISGTRQRELLSNHEVVPPELSRPEVVAILREYYQGL